MTPHATLPVCPFCDAKEKVVIDLDHHVFHCFNCQRSGTVDIRLTEFDPPEVPAST